MSQTRSVLQKPPGYRDPTVPVQRPRPPPRKPSIPPSFYRHKERRSRCCRCCCFLFLLIVILIIFSIAVIGFFYVWFQPRLPVFHLKSLHMPKFNVTASPEGTALDAQTVVILEVRNPNSELKIVFDRTKIYLDNGDGLELGSASLPGFTQERKNVTVLRFTTQVKNFLVSDDVGAKLKDEHKSKSLSVSTNARTGVGMSVDGWSTRTVNAKVICGAMSLKQVERAIMPKCKINVLKWP